MKSTHATNKLNEIDAVISNIDGFENLSEIHQHYLACYLVVFICGKYEDIIEAILNEKVGRIGRRYISNFFNTYLHENFRNPNYGSIVQLLGRFDPEWKEAIQQIPEINRTALNNIVTNKNKVSHGENPNITLQEVKTYYYSSKLFIDKLDTIIL